MTLIVRPYSLGDQEYWDDFCKKTDQSTILHTRQFLNYHRNRFIDRSVLIEEDGKLLGLFPAAEHPTNRKCIVSHPGATFGAVLHNGGLQGSRMIDSISLIGQHYGKMNYQNLIYKAVPCFYQKRPTQDDLYALFRLGARRIRCDLSSTIDLENRGGVSERRRRGLKKTLKADIEITTTAEYLPDLWRVLTENLERKHGVKPVHSLNEITELIESFPQNIICYSCVSKEEILGGVLIFRSQMVDHAQYIASSEKGYKVSALDATFEYCIEQARQMGSRWFDFGISTEENGMLLNDGLYSFKSEFGAGGFVHEFYEINLENLL